MHRRPLGRGRWLAAISAVVILVGCILPWYTAGGGEGIPAVTIDAFGGAGILTFMAALGALALVALPYASGDHPVGVDRALSYWLLLVLGLIGIVLRLIDIVTSGLPIDGLRPDRALGYWITVLGLIVLSRAAFEIAQRQEQ